MDISAASITSDTILLVEGDLSDLGHVRSYRTPRVITRRCSGQYEGLYCCSDCSVPLRTFTSTCEYPLVTFLTLLTTFDIVAAWKLSQLDRHGERDVPWCWWAGSCGEGAVGSCSAGGMTSSERANRRG